ncbi:peptidase inhibitor family I36 protein, partial [Actinomyces bowdenii]
MTTISLRRAASGASILALAIGALALPTTAQATERDGVCDSGEVCFYHNSNQQGSVSDFTGSIPNYGDSQPNCYEFKGPGKGKGNCLKNDAASVKNNTDQPVTVYYNSNYKGASQTIPAGASVNLDPALKNNNASHQIGTDTTNTP